MSFIGEDITRELEQMRAWCNLIRIAVLSFLQAAGVLVDVRSPEALAAAMLALGASPSERARYAGAGHESARRRFHVSVVSALYERLYEEVANHGVR